MARNLKTLLAFEVSRNSFIAEQVNKISTLSESDIDLLSIKPWQKKALKLYKTDNKFQKPIINEQFIIDNTRFFFSSDPKGKTYEFAGTTRFVKLDRGDLELREGALFWIPTTGGILYETLFSNFIDSNVYGKFICISTRTEYSNAYKEKIKQYTATFPEASDISSGPLASYGVRISK